MRILAFGVLNRPRGKYTINDNARIFLHPPGIEREGLVTSTDDAFGEMVVGSSTSNRSSNGSMSFDGLQGV